MRKFIAVALSGALAVTSLGMTAAQAAPLGSAPLSAVTAAPAMENSSLVDVQSRRYYGGRGGYYRNRGYHGGYRGHRGDAAGAAVAAGVIGLTAGIIAGQALASPPRGAPAYGGEAYVDQDWLDYCYARYRSFDPHSGTYVGYDGRRHLCRRPGID